MKKMLSGRKEKARIIYAYVFSETLAPSFPPIFPFLTVGKLLNSTFTPLKNFVLIYEGVFSQVV